MGTNYFLVKKDNECKHCGRADEERRHIGKSSGGWCFGLHVYPDEGISDLADWKVLFVVDGVVIENEYGEVIPVDVMVDEITNRSWRRPNPMTDAEMRMNYAVSGPNGLMRHRIASDHCIGHGAGTWDLCVGEFS